MLKNSIYMKMILFFAAVSIVTILTLSYLLFNLMSESIIDRELETQRHAMEQISQYLEYQQEVVDALMQNIYRNSLLADHLSYMLQHSFQEYMSFYLDQVYLNTASNPDVIQTFRHAIEDNPSISNIILYSAEKQYIFALSQTRQAKLVDTNVSHSYVPDVMSVDREKISVPNIWVSQAIGEENPRLYSVRTSINDMNSLRSIGQLRVYFYADAIHQVLANYSEKIRGYIVVLTSDGKVLFDSSETYYGQDYPYFEQIMSLQMIGDFEQRSYLTTYVQPQDGYIIASIAPVDEIAESYMGLRNTMLSIGILAVILLSTVPALLILNFARRTNRIIKYMHKAEQGDLSVRLPEAQKDELGQISQSFNEMLEELSNYIERSYKAEIKKKHAELEAIQAKINPHFLYNTLEVIRMRAISQGAKDVGEMIYSLSVLFKHLVKDKDGFTWRDEVETCRLYLELFRIRYKDKFVYDIECDSQLLDQPVLRMLLQPVVENYVVHGMKMGSTDNKISIRIREMSACIEVEVRDNGKGMSADRLSHIQALLREHDETENSFGLLSVHERIQLSYGKSYGVTITSQEGEGTTVSIRIPVYVDGGDGNV